MLMFRKSNKDNGEKIFRYSIRKYHFGAASVAVAALMFFANGVQAQAPEVSLATASEMVAGSAGNSDGDPQESDEGELKKTVIEQPAEGESAGELKAQGAKAEEANQGQGLDKSKSAPGGQEGPQVGEIKEREESTPTADKTAAKSTQGTLEALLANLTLDSMKALHAEVEEGLAKAKAVLENPKATQEQVDEQVRAMEELTRRVNQALEPSLPKLTDLGEAGSTNNKLVEPNGTATEQATGGKRRKRGGLTDLEPAANQVSPSDGGKEAAPEANSQSTPQELPTYTNTTEGENGVYGLKKELEDITKELRRYGASEDKIQAAKAAADKFNEAFSKGHTINQEDFDAALVDLKKSRDLIEGVLEEKYGEETRVGGVTPQPRDGGEELPSRGRGRRVVRATRDGSNDYNTSREYYFEDDNKGGSPYVKYTYIFHSRRQRGVYDNVNREVKDAKNYIYANVTSTVNGFRWDLYFNQGHNTLVGNPFWFTVPKDQTYINGTATLTRQFFDNGRNVIRGEEAHSPNIDSIEAALSQKFAGLSDVTVGNNKRSGARKRGAALTEQLNVGSLNDLARQSNRGLYDRRLEKGEDAKRSDAKFDKINNTDSNLYYFTLPDTKDSYHLSFETRGTNDIRKLAYAVGSKGKDKEGNIYTLYLANQWYAITYEEAKQGAKDDIQQARQHKNDSLSKNGKLSSAERNNATRIVNNHASQATSRIGNANSFAEVEDALRQGLENINGVNPIGKDLPKEAIKQAANTKRGEIDRQAGLTDEEKATAKRTVTEKETTAISNVDKATTNTAVDTAKTTGVTEITNVTATGTKKPEAKEAIKQAATAKTNEIENASILPEDKAKLKEQVESEKTKGINNVNGATDQATVNSKRAEAVSTIQGISLDAAKKKKAAKDLADAKADAIQKIKDKATAKTNEIENASILPEDKAKLKQQVEEAKDNAINEVNGATSPDDATTKRDKAIGTINGIGLTEAEKAKVAKDLADAKADAIQKIKDAATAKKAGAKELPNTGTEQSRASLALALLAAATGGLLIAKKREEEE